MNDIGIKQVAEKIHKHASEFRLSAGFGSHARPGSERHRTGVIFEANAQ
jgi:hypothetical protein